MSENNSTDNATDVRLCQESKGMRAKTVKNCKILIGCFIIQFLVSGATRLSSIYFVESITRYNVDRKQASFPFVITYMVKNLAGPIMGFLEQIIGMKWIITIGCVMATLGIGGCFFAEEILAITILWGIILGLSYGFAYNMQAPLLNQHFKRNKNKANGFVSAGSSLGGVLLPVIATTCIQIYGTSGSFLILSAIIAHSIPASLLLENPTTKSIPKENTKVVKKSDNKKKSLVNMMNTTDYLRMEQTNKYQSSSKVENDNSEGLSASNSSPDNDIDNEALTNIQSTDYYLKNEQTHKCLSSSNVKKISDDHRNLNSPLSNCKNDKIIANISITADYFNMEQTCVYLSNSTVKETSYEDISTSNSSLNNSKNDKIHANISNTADYLDMEQTHKCLSISTVKEISCEDISTSNLPLNNSVKNRSLSKISNDDNYLSEENTQKYRSSSSVDNISSENFNTSNSSLNETLDEIKQHTNELPSCDSTFSNLNKVINEKEQCKNVEMFNKFKFASRNFRIFIDPTFIVILIFNGLVAAVIVTVWTIILDFVRDKEVPESLEIYYVILLPLTDILGRLGSGYIADKNFLSFPQLCFITFFIDAMALFLIVYVNNFMLVMACEIVISICFGMTVILQITMVDNYMDEDLKTMAQSCRVMLYAPLSLIISPMLGYFRGGFGSYNYVFYILSGATLFCGCSVYLLPYLANKKDSLQRQHVPKMFQGHLNE